MRPPLPHSLLLLCGLGVAQAASLADHVRTDTGSIGGGNTFPGVSRPLGMVKLGPDLYTGRDSYSGYAPDGRFMGFSMLHESGTGGAPKYGVVAQMPVLGDIPDPLADLTAARGKADETEVGYYKSTLESGIEVELAATYKAGFYKYTFPEDKGAPGIIVDVSHVLSSYRNMGLEQHYLGGHISVSEDGDEGHLSYQGYGDYDNGWNKSPRWRVYFCGYFDKPATFKTFRGTGSSGRFMDDDSVDFSEERLGAMFTFEDRDIESRVGVSFISTEKACRSVNDEIPKGATLAELKEATREDWEARVLSTITTTEEDPEKLAQLYSALYFMNLLPQNKTGENPMWDSDEPYYDDIFTFWDTFRCTTALFHILMPDAHEELIRSWVDIWRNEGFMSDARSSFWSGAVQGGSNVDNVFADAYVKGVRGKIDWDDAYEAMRTNAEVVPPVGTDDRDPGGSAKEGRGALSDWKTRGYISTDFKRSVSRAVEYSVNDFALYQVARGLNRDGDAEKYLERSRNWRNHWNSDMKALNHTGFIGPRGSNGAFIDQDPLSCGGCYWGDHYYQGLPWEYTFNAHHDVATLVHWVGGDDKFRDRLDLTFQPGARPGQGGTIFNTANEPSFGTPFLYNFIGRQDLSVKTSHSVAREHYHPTPDGLPGNSDAGAMESWLLWTIIGMYPLTGQTTFLITAPRLADLTIHMSGGRTLEITAEGISDTAIYVQSLKVNGRNWDRSWLTWEDVFQDGGKMEFILGEEPRDWATGPLPPSPATEGQVEPPRKRDLVGNLTSGLIALAVLAAVAVTFAVARMLMKRRDRKRAEVAGFQAIPMDVTSRRSSGESASSSRSTDPSLGFTYSSDSSDSDLEKGISGVTVRRVG